MLPEQEICILEGKRTSSVTSHDTQKLKWTESTQKIYKKSLRLFLEVKILHPERYCYKNVKSRHKRKYLQNMYYSENSYPKSTF